MPNVEVPEGWFWAKLNEPRAGLRRIGYYYRDPTAGYSFHVLGELDATRETLERAHKGTFRGESTMRLSGHESLHVHTHTPPDALKMMQAEFASATTPMVLQLSAQERDALGLPEVPPWALNYLASPAPAPKPAWQPSTPTAPSAPRGPRPVRWYPGHYVAGIIGVCLAGFGTFAFLSMGPNVDTATAMSFAGAPLVVGFAILGWLGTRQWFADRAAR